MNTTESYPFHKASKITKFLWWCAGADSYFLMRSPAQDRVKYAGIGGIVLCTGVLAMVSGGFAFHTAFGPKSYALKEAEGASWIFIAVSFLFAIAWGLVIFNLDRFIVSSTGKGDGTDKMTRKEVGNALPRIVIALVLGFAISTPLEIKILESEIDSELDKFQKAYTAELNDASLKLFEQNKAQLEKNKKEVEEKITGYESELKEYDDKIDALKNDKKAEMQDRRAYGEGAVAKALQRTVDEKIEERARFVERRAADVTRFNQELLSINEQLKGLESKLAEDRKTNEDSSHKYNGLLKRIQISHEIGGWIPWVIFFVLLSIEMGPIFFKMMMNKGPYDYMVENWNYRLYVKNGIVREDHIFEGRDGMRVIEKMNYLEVEQDRREKQDQIAKQDELSKKILGIWAEKKKSQIDEKPESFYNENSTNPQA